MIPPQAVEAAAKIHYEHHLLIWEDAHPLSRAKVLDEMRAALEAAAPYMQAEAWDEGYDGAIDAFDGRNVSNPYRTTNAR